MSRLPLETCLFTHPIGQPGGVFSCKREVTMPPWVRHVKRILGVGFCHYESTALTVDDDGVVPKWTSLCHPNPDGGHMENRIRLGLALGSCLWVFVHLMRPWVLRWSRRGAR